MSQAQEWTLSEVARLLGQPQHKLIHLCEKGAVVPDFQQASGRGSSRRFSARNVLEFAVALKLRDLALPVMPVAGILHILREFERRVAGQLLGFRLPDALRKPKSPNLQIILIDGRQLFFTMGAGGKADKIFGGWDYQELAGLKQEDLKGLTRRIRTRRQEEVLELVEGKHTRVEVNVTQIARDLPLDA